MLSTQRCACSILRPYVSVAFLIEEFLTNLAAVAILKRAAALQFAHVRNRRLAAFDLTQWAAIASRATRHPIDCEEVSRAETALNGLVDRHSFPYGVVDL